MTENTAKSLRVANGFAARATRAYLEGRGLAAEIDDARFPEDHDPLPVPQLDALVAALGVAAGEACIAGDRVALLCSDPEADDAIATALDDTLAATVAAERTTRTLAQLLLGVTSHLGENDAVARAERAAVMVLHPPDAAIVPLVDDGLVFHARYGPELITELCGALCRMIIDHDCVLHLRASPSAARSIELCVDEVGNLAASLEVSAAEVEGLVDLGWDLGCEGWVEASWTDPLVVVNPARLALDTLRMLAPDADPGDVVATVEWED